MWRKLLDIPFVYEASQRFLPYTVQMCRELVRTRVQAQPSDKVLDIGCGVGSHRVFFGPDFTGVDIIPACIERAQAVHAGTFQVMDCTKLAFPDNSFDVVFTVAITHHLSPGQFSDMVREAIRVAKPGSHVHIIDAIRPIDAHQWLKEFVFAMDRGRFPRKLHDHRAVVSTIHPIAVEEVSRGRLHDVCYFRLDKLA